MNRLCLPRSGGCDVSTRSVGTRVVQLAYLTLSAPTGSRNRAFSAEPVTAVDDPGPRFGYNRKSCLALPCPVAEVDLPHQATTAGALFRCGLAVALGAIWLLASGGFAHAEDLSPRPTMEHAIGPFVQAYCIDCHRGDSAEAGLDFDK